MSYSFGEIFRVTCFGQSHSKSIGGVIEGIPAGIRLDTDETARFMSRRAPGRNQASTSRSEPDTPVILSGLNGNNVTSGSPLAFEIANTDVRSADYGERLSVPRPMHADYPAFARWGDSFDFRGGGQFSGRMTAVMCFAGGVARQLLSSQGITVGAHAASIFGIHDLPFDPCAESREKLLLPEKNEYPVIDECACRKMLAAIEKARAEGDSVGGTVECAAIGLPVGIGEPLYDSVESRISQLLFSIPAVKGVGFGAGFAAAEMRGSAHNDPFFVENGRIMTLKNDHGGILGGLTTGMPLIFSVSVKPTPSIAKIQDSVDMREMKNTRLEIKGRHDPCIVMRAVPCVISACACALADLMLIHGGYEWN